MIGVKKLSLGEVAKIVTGVTPSSKFADNWGTEIPFLTPTDISGFDYKIITERCLSKESIKRLNSRVIPPNSIAVVCIGTIGQIGFIREPTLTNQQINTLIPNTKIVSAEFVYYYLQLMTQQLEKIAGGSNVPMLPKSTFEKVEIHVPALKDQELIVSKLVAIDNLVAVNTEIIVNIENTLNQIYNRYFANPKKDWNIVNLSSLVNVVTGKRDANYASNSGPYNFFTCSEKILKCDDYAFEGKAILIAGNGNFNIKLFDGKFDAYQRTYVLIPSKEDFYSLIYLAVKDRIQSLSQNSRGSIVKFITKGDIEDIPIVIPDAEHLYLLKTMNRLTKLLELKKAENSEIISRRNLYLPFLFSKILS